MAGMECPECFEETKRYGDGETVADAKERPAYRRFRVCVNPECRLYLIRLSTLEVYAPLQSEPQAVRPRHTFRHVAPRSAPLPDEPIPGVNA